MSFFPDEHRDQTPYVQCVLERPRTHGRQYRVGWIPACYAVHGKILRIRDAGGWSDGWTVTTVGAKRSGAPHVPGLIRQHERATGDALPKRK